jgi:hypothetical protein
MWGGFRDCADFLTETGPMIEPLRDPAFFQRVFVEDGVPTWPNGFDPDPINPYMQHGWISAASSTHVDE